MTGAESWPDPYQANCPSRQLLDLIADKWSVLVLSAIADGIERNGGLLRSVGGISQKSLTRTLRDLERNGLVARRDYQEIPPRVEYTLTEVGESMRPVLRAMCQWSIEHIDAVYAARARYAG
ncbi:MAG: winged helix-turn-helix transcriptional regulator [Nocardioides sp.]